MGSNTDFAKYPTGKIPKGSFCNFCKKYNSRYVACDNIAVKDNKILLVKRAHEPYKDFWALPGGYLDWDETVEDCVKRELREETGYDADVEFLGVNSDPKRNERQNVVLFFRSVVKKRKKEFDKENEISIVSWFELDKLPDMIVPHHKQAIKKYAILK